MYLRLIGLAFIFAFSPLFSISPPDLSAKDTRIKIEEILRAHVSHHELTTELTARAFLNYLDEIDPGKTYLLKKEVLMWIEPDVNLLKEATANVKKGDFSHFQTLHEAVLPAIDRRREFERSLVSAPLPEGVQSSDFKNLDWVEDENELRDRLLSIRSLQMDAADKFDLDTKEQFVKRLEKRRLKREEELVPKSSKQRKKLVLALTLKSISSALDSQTAYFTPAEANQFMIQVQQRLFGIGAQLRDDLNGFTVVRLLEGGPAKESGNLHVNDKIIGVNGEPVVGMEIIEAVELIRGPKGSPVQLTVLRDQGEGSDASAQSVDVELTRGEVVLKETRLEKSYEPFGDGVIGVLHLFSFYQDSRTSSTEDLKEAIEEMRTSHNLKGIILDLRDNAGGLLPQAVSVTGLFIKKGIVVSIKDNTGMVQHLRNIDGNVMWDGPLAVLTNRTSASAAEIVAQTLQDYGRAIVIGDPTTFGKGTFQTFTLESSNYGKVNNKGEYKVTRGRYYTVSGRSPQLIGVQPDIIVPGMYSELEIGEQYSKFPLENESICPNFEDDLSDVPASHRAQISRLYKFNLQEVITTYTSYMDILRENSKTRIEQNKNYQSFLEELSNAKENMEKVKAYAISDLQYFEAANILKDLIFLMDESRVCTETYAEAG